jgi:hypothetical protein
MSFTPGQTLGRGDLDLFLTDANGIATNAAVITYALYYVDPGPPEVEVLIGSATRTPVNPAIGEYYAALMVPPTATPGTYRIRWTFQQYVNSTPQQVVQEWQVVTPDTQLTAVQYTPCQTDLIRRLRILLRDNNPDKNYHFRPPQHEGAIDQFNRIFGRIWEDDELLEYLERGLDWWNMFPPSTRGMDTLDKLCAEYPAWRTAVMWAAITHACFAVAANWVADEFDYSIGGVSLSIERSSKYESLKQNAEGQFDKATEAKARTVKFIRGLQQPKYGVGVRSAFGPYVGRGVLSPRSFLVLPFFLWFSGLASSSLGLMA